MLWKFFVMSALLIGVGVPLRITHAATGDEFYWFREDVPCENYKVTVRSYCADEDFVPKNGFCTKQELVIRTSEGKSKTVSLKFKKYRKERLTAGSFLCRPGKDKKMYVVIVFSNGGSCEECESADILRIDGKWQTTAGENFGDVANKLGIALTPWPSDDFTYTRNKKREQ